MTTEQREPHFWAWPGDTEHFHVEDPEELVQDWCCRMGASSGEPFAPQALVVVGWAPVVPESVMITAIADQAYDFIVEKWWEEFGDPEDCPDVDVLLETDIYDALKRFAGRASVWACEEVCRRTYSVGEVAAIWRRLAEENDHPVVVKATKSEALELLDTVEAFTGWNSTKADDASQRLRQILNGLPKTVV